MAEPAFTISTGKVSRTLLEHYVATSLPPADSRHLVLEDFEGAGVRVADRRFAAKDMIFAPGDPDDWLALTTGVTLAYKRLETGRNSANAPGPSDTGDVPAGRAAALLLLSYYLPAVV